MSGRMTGTHGAVGAPTKKVYLRFDVTQNAPDYTQIFKSTGGQLNAMAVAFETDASVSGCRVSSKITFSPQGRASVSIELAEFEFLEERTPEDEPRVALPNRARLMMSSQRVVTAINGTLATSLACEGSIHLHSLLSSPDNTQMGLVYKTFLAHAESHGFSRARVVSVDTDAEAAGREGAETMFVPVFQKPADDVSKMLEAAEQLVERYAKAGFDARQAVVYGPSPMLHKTVFSEIVGVNGKGYCLLHDIMLRESNMTPATLDELYRVAIAVDCCQDKADVSAFLLHANKPGIAAAAQARTVAFATSLIVNVLMSYRADGRNVVTPAGCDFASVENWDRANNRTCLQSNDCDGLALAAVELVRSAIKHGESEKYPYLHAVRNVVNPFYQVVLSVIGASSAEATSAGSSATAAGHAIVLMIPTLSFLRALSKTMDKRVGKSGTVVTAPEGRAAVEKARFAALFPPDIVAAIPDAREREALKSWESAQKAFANLEAFAVEGTTPASPVLFVADPTRRRDAEDLERRDKIAFAKAAANVMRSVKSLHVGGSKSGSTHQFYLDFVELTFSPDSPLYTDDALRAMNAAATQFVLVSEPDGAHVEQAGCTPRQMAMESYGAFPLVQVSAAVAKLLDFASAEARSHSMPPRASGTTKLSRFQTDNLAKSLAHINAFAESMAKKQNGDVHGAHCVNYICAFNTLVFNPIAIGTFIKKLETVAVGGVVDVAEVKGLAKDADDAEAGRFVHLTIYVPT